MEHLKQTLGTAAPALDVDMDDDDDDDDDDNDDDDGNDRDKSNQNRRCQLCGARNIGGLGTSPSPSSSPSPASSSCKITIFQEPKSNTRLGAVAPPAHKSRARATTATIGARGPRCLLVLLLISLLAHVAPLNAERMVRLCIASVDPAKLSSQCVMCNRREFPLTVIDCTGITKVNDLIANPLSVQEAKCLIYNCRRQVPQIKPEPYRGSANNAASQRGASAALASTFRQQQHQPPLASFVSGPSAHVDGPIGPLGIPGPIGPINPVTGSGSQVYEMMTPSSLFGANFNSNSVFAPQPGLGPLRSASFRSRYGYPSPPTLDDGARDDRTTYTAASHPLATSVLKMPRGIIGGPNLMPSVGQQALPYALIPAPSTGLLPFGPRKYKAALIPLFR